jgi:hypothetical protein
MSSGSVLHWFIRRWIPLEAAVAPAPAAPRRDAHPDDSRRRLCKFIDEEKE